jgi:hypothetical protein
MDDNIRSQGTRPRRETKSRWMAGGGSLGDDAADEVVVADGAVGRDVDLADPLVELVRLELLADGGEDVAEVGDGDGAGGVLVEDAEGVAERAVEGLGAEVGAHEVEEAREVEGRRELLLRGDVAELRLRGVPAEGAHEDAELGGRDAAVAVGVEEGEGLPHGGDLVVAQRVAAHRRRWKGWDRRRRRSRARWSLGVSLACGSEWCASEGGEMNDDAVAGGGLG